MPTLLLALALLAQDPADDAPEVVSAPAVPITFEVYVVRPLTPGCAWLEVTDGGEGSWFVTVESDRVPAAVVWHLDGATPLSLTTLQPGTRLRCTGPSSSRADRVEVVCLGPLAFGLAVEEFVAEASGRRLSAGLTATEVATVEAMGSASFLVREAVSRELRDQGLRVLRLAVWGARCSPDAEVRARARGLLERLGWSG